MLRNAICCDLLGGNLPPLQNYSFSNVRRSKIAVFLFTCSYIYMVAYPPLIYLIYHGQ